jgi:hypothetical protein
MSKRISFRGQVPDGEQDRIRLKTIKGKMGYRIRKFHICGPNMGNVDDELTGKIYKTDQTGNISGSVNFTESDLLAVAFYNDAATTSYGNDQVIIFDNEVINQDIFVYGVDNSGNTNQINYYIELEAMFFYFVITLLS